MGRLVTWAPRVELTFGGNCFGPRGLDVFTKQQSHHGNKLPIRRRATKNLCQRLHPLCPRETGTKIKVTGHMVWLLASETLRHGKNKREIKDQTIFYALFHSETELVVYLHLSESLDLLFFCDPINRERILPSFSHSSHPPKPTSRPPPPAPFKRSSPISQLDTWIKSCI